MAIRHKFNAKRTKVGERSYPSKLEAAYSQKLDRLKESGELIFYLEQVPISLPGGIKYRVDFVEFHRDGNVLFSECKGMETKDFIIKKKLLAEAHPYIELNIIRKV